MAFLRLLHRVEAVCVALATAGAVSGIKHPELGVPLDKWGLWADLGAGIIFVINLLRKGKHA